MAQLDPSSAVPQDLIPHVHLLSSNRYPMLAHIDVNQAIGWLMEAPHVARDRAPFFWTYLDKIVDGTTLLTWQPLQRLGTTFASDGAVWAPPEQLYKHDIGNGLILEIYYHKGGYVPGEQYAMHARRRFRLVPAPGHQTPHQPDVSLFLVHYSPAEPNDRIPAQTIPYDERVNAMMQQRAYLFRSGHLRRKDFMLSDRVNWPTLPELTGNPAAPQQQMPRGVPQQMAYPSQTTPSAPPAKRARHGSQAQSQKQAQHQQGPMAAMPGMQQPIDDEEDSWRGDIFDHLTPREVSLSRYQQNHEWMEEIISSPYKMSQITASDLGLGLTGELASLTKGIFATYSREPFEPDGKENPFVGRLDAEQADEFRKRVDEHIKSTKAEIEKMQADHAKTLADFKKSSVFSVKEKELRSIVEGAGPEVWRVEGKTDSADDEDHQLSKKTVDEVVQELESSSGRKVEPKPDVNRVQEGGYQTPAPEPVEPESAPAGSVNMSRQPSQAPSQASGMMTGGSDIDMGNTAAGLLDQMHTGLSTTSTPVNNFPTPQPQLSAAQSNAATPTAANNAASPAADAPAAASQAGGDVSMGGTEGTSKEQPETTPDQGTGSGDWVVVPKGVATPDAGASAAGTPSSDAAAAGAKSAASAAAGAKPPSAAATPAVTEGGSVTFDQNDFSSLGDLDTAGDALAGYDAPALDGSAGELGEGLDLNMDMDDSAFGDAFHGVGATGTPGDSNSNM